MGKVLIIEDDSLLVKVYSTRLKKDGHQVVSSYQGQAGLELAKKEKPNVILLDIMLPKMSGLEVLSALKQDPATAQVPVLIYSNLARETEKAKAKELGAAEFIVKAEFNPKQVVAKIEAYLDQDK